jgi:uncharacterized protein YyaL (SSP411 family)
VGANLYELTSNNMYLNTALLAATFIDDNMRASSLIANSIDVSNCGLGSDGGAIDSAIAIRAWVTMYDITHDSQWRDKRVI